MTKTNIDTSKIKIADSFQYSINIGFDLNNIEKIENYIPTTEAINLIEDIMLSTSPTSNDRARIFVGAYGKGKSHLALIITALLSKKDKKIFKVLLDRIRDYNIELYRFLNNYICSDSRLLPIIVQGSNENLRQSLLGALKHALHKEGLDNLMPSTYFVSAIKMIQKWRSDYQETFKGFINLIDEDIATFISKLENYSYEHYEKFVSLYPSLTSGSEFNPLSGAEVTELYEEVSIQIKKRGYNGLFIVYDEFSKYLEGNVESSTAMDIKTLQDLAEKCNRSKKNQMNILLIAHKNISNYIDKLPKEKIDAWKAVSERFKSVELVNGSAQTYDLISHVIQKDDKWYKEYKNINSLLFKDLKRKFSKYNTFFDLNSNEYEAMIEGCFPLDPISTFVLPRISEKIAQNERTIFTFLSSKNQKYTLTFFLKNIGNGLVTPDCIYDYFEALFKNETYASKIYKEWKIISNSLQLLDKELVLEIKLLKTLGLINILDQFSLLPPDINTLIDIYSGWSYSYDEVMHSVEELKSRGIIRANERNKYLRIIEKSNVNIEELILDTIERRKKNVSIAGVLNYEADKIYLYPSAYNDKFEIIRYFNLEFIKLEDLMDIEDWEKRTTNLTGTLFAIITNNKIETAKAQEIVKNIKFDRAVFIISNSNFNVKDIVYKYEAIKYLKETNQDEVIQEELSYYFEDINLIIQDYINQYIKPEKGKSSYYLEGIKQVINRKSHLSKLLSDICMKTYDLTPVIRNEVINKDLTTSTAVNSRRKILTGLLENEIKIDLGLSGTSQDISFFRSTIKNFDIYIDYDGTPKIKIDSLDDEKIQTVLNIIKNFILSTTNEGAKSIGELYHKLTHPSYRIGLKKGVIPIYFACILHAFKRYTVITKKDMEIEITASLLDSINENPQDYYIKLEEWNNDKANYIESLETTFERYLVINEKEYNTFDYIVRAMQRWFLGLPKYSKEINKIFKGKRNYTGLDKSVKKFRLALKKSEINSREFLFETIPFNLNLKEWDSNIVENINEIKYRLDNILDELYKVLNREIIDIFKIDQSDNASLYTVMKDWYESLSQEVKKYLFDNGEGRVLLVISNINNNTNEFIESLTRILTGLRIEDWEENTPGIFLDNLIEFKSIIENQNAAIKEKSNNTSGYKIILQNDQGQEVMKTFDKVAYSNRAKLLYNEILSNIEDYGTALSDGEKRQVLIEMLEKYLR